MKKLTVAICVDERNGVLFAGRRQSRDRLLIADLLKNTNGKRVCITPFSKLLFENDSNVLVCQDLFAEAPDQSICFAEDTSLLSHVEDIQTLILYHWNRHYPADRYLDIDPVKHGFALTERSEFAGSSHDKITKEVYQK